MSEYTLVTDQGGNIGLLCPVCKQARWSEDHQTNDWSTGQDCPNCSQMKTDGDFVKEKVKYDIAKEKAELEIREAEIAEQRAKEDSAVQFKKQTIKDLEQKSKKDEQPA